MRRRGVETPLRSSFRAEAVVRPEAVSPEEPPLMPSNYTNSISVAAALFAVACINRPLCDEDCRPRTTNQFVTEVTGKAVDKIDLLFMIDNSTSMDDKQKVLEEAVPDLVERLVNPNCVNPNDPSVPPQKAASPDADCPAPLMREFTPIRDIHVGIVTSSLGNHGDNSYCASDDSNPVTQENNDHGWLIGSRSRFSVPSGGQAPTPEGFLDWNPDTDPNASLGAFKTTFAQMTVAVGSQGCGYESQLESAYRFLVDPNPYATIVLQNCPGSGNKCAYPTGRDAKLLAQRAAFLRQDSLVAIILLTDENDCSIRESGQGYYASSTIALPRAATICASNPNDPCCYSCAEKPPTGCAKDPICDQNEPGDTSKQAGLRCFHEVQRFGIDFLYPTARYVNAFSQPQLCTSLPALAPADASCPDADGDRKPDIVDNPLFKTDTAATRDPSLVFVAGIIGVPWQDIASSKTEDGTDYPSGELHYQNADQLAANKTWDVILGNDNPGDGQPPIPAIDALMQESQGQRSGVDDEQPPKPLADPSAGYLANPINGHEWLTGTDDLQYACIFKLNEADAKQCANADVNSGCDCEQDGVDAKNPLCQDSSGNYSTTQRFAKAYPGLRELQVLKDLDKHSIVASICARNLEDDTRQDYGYRPAVDAIVDRLKEVLTGSCLPRQLVPDQNGQLPCSVVEARPIPTSGTPACSATPGRLDPDPGVIAPALAQLKSIGACDAANKPACSEFYVCKIQEAGPDCHTGDEPKAPGWCYIDPASQPNDNAALVKNCPATERRALRFVDPNHRTPEHDAIALVACFGASVPDDGTPMSGGAQ
ncbi:MAG TPA: hypothetical protein VHC69_07325 [Polyangiaceae bacterium]|nr:hypothetical protein [Polyangiaceae bacterium]